MSRSLRLWSTLRWNTVARVRFAGFSLWGHLGTVAAISELPALNLHRQPLAYPTHFGANTTFIEPWRRLRGRLLPPEVHVRAERVLHQHRAHKDLLCRRRGRGGGVDVRWSVVQARRGLQDRLETEHEPHDQEGKVLVSLPVLMTVLVIARGLRGVRPTATHASRTPTRMPIANLALRPLTTRRPLALGASTFSLGYRD